MEVPADFERDVARSEQAMAEHAKPAARALCAALVKGRLEGLPFAPGFRGRLSPSATETEQRETSATDAAGFRSAAEAYAAGFRPLQRCGLGVQGFRQHDGGAWVDLVYEAAGQVEGRATVHKGRWRATLDSEWRWLRIDASWKARSSPLPPFAEVGAQVGVVLPRDAVGEAALGGLRDAAVLDTIGGLAVRDHDADGAPDLLAWNRRRFMRLYRNDGVGGFTARDLLPPEHVGLFQLFVDLDGDGADELLSTEVLGCAAGVATLGLYDAAGQRRAALDFEAPCVAAVDPRLEHATAGDIDGDGDLDLFIAAYAADSQRGNFSRYDSQDGLRNLLFVNQGGLRFTEEGRARGLIGTRLSYVGELFDLDGDADLDLFVANDFGPNEVYLNEAGRFTATQRPPLTDHLASMGITVADLDADGRLDLYVSNMDSKAGRRIVDLTTGLAPTTIEALKGFAAGNTFYSGATGFTVESASELGFDRASWAWGQAAFDLENDGDLDLYVVNGFTSHRRIREHDY